MERFRLKKLNKVKSIIGLKSRNKFAALENLDAQVDTNRA
jgi:hypothetical protein